MSVSRMDTTGYKPDESGEDKSFGELRNLHPELSSKEKPKEEGLQKYDILTNPEERRELVRLMESFVDEIRSKNVKNIIFLDKSARPLATAFQDIWQRKYGSDTSERPQINFINIGTESFIDWEDGTYADNLDDPKMISESQRVAKKYKYLKEALPNSEIVIFEELTHRGYSLAVAKKFLEMAFPHLQFSTFSLTKTPDTPFVRDRGYGPPWGAGGEYGIDNITGVVDPSEDQHGSVEKVTAEPRRELFKRITEEMNNEALHSEKRADLEKAAYDFLHEANKLLNNKSLSSLQEGPHSQIIQLASMDWRELSHQDVLSMFLAKVIIPVVQPYIISIELSLQKVTQPYEEAETERRRKITDVYTFKRGTEQDIPEHKAPLDLVTMHQEALRELEQLIVGFKVKLNRLPNEMNPKIENIINEWEKNYGPDAPSLDAYLRYFVEVANSTLDPIWENLEILVKDQPHAYDTSNEYRELFDEKAKQITQLRQEIHSAIEEYWQGR